MAGPGPGCGASRVERIVTAWAALAARRALGEVAGIAFMRGLVADGRTEDDVETACDLFDLELDVEVAGLRGRVEDLDAEVDAANRALHRSEVAVFGEAAVTFAHAAHPDVATVMEARDAMTATDWLIFDRMAEPLDPEGMSA